MKHVKFKDSNRVFGKEQSEYETLHALALRNGTITSCWKLSLMDSIRIMFTGKVWLCLKTSENSLPPQLLSTTKPFRKQWRSRCL